MRGLSASKLLFSRPTFRHRPLSMGSRSSPKKMEGPGEDFRPPWVYIGSNLVSWAVIPGIVFYSIFFYDFGDHEHVFQPPRRWARRVINNFFTLSPTEEKLLLQDSQQSKTADVVPEKAV